MGLDEVDRIFEQPEIAGDLSLTGDFPGAIADFQAFIKWTNDEDKKSQRQAWIEMLKVGKNPFTDEVLEQLKNQ